MPRWTFDRPDRLAALAGRASALADHLWRESIDAPRGSAERAGFLGRLAVVDARARRLRELARVIRRDRRLERGAA